MDTFDEVKVMSEHFEDIFKMKPLVMSLQEYKLDILVNQIKINDNTSDSLSSFYDVYHKFLGSVETLEPRIAILKKFDSFLD